MGKRENDYQSGLIDRIKDRFDGCMVLKNDSSYIRGIPDLLVLYKDKWAALECKRGNKASHRPLQDYYVNKMNDMSYSSFIDPDNEQEVLDEMEQTFSPRRTTCISRRK